MGVTAVALVAARSAPTDLSERALVDLVVAAVLAESPDGGSLDSHALAEVLFDRRVAAGRTGCDAVQTKDYCQHLLRESSGHVCRHADGHHYRVHPEVSCSSACDERFAHAAAAVRREACEFCHLELTTTGDCPLGC